MTERQPDGDYSLKKQYIDLFIKLPQTTTGQSLALQSRNHAHRVFCGENAAHYFGIP